MMSHLLLLNNDFDAVIEPVCAVGHYSLAAGESGFYLGDFVCAAANDYRATMNDSFRIDNENLEPITIGNKRLERSGYRILSDR